MKTKVVIYVSAAIMLLFGIFMGYEFPNLAVFLSVLELAAGIGFGYYYNKAAEFEAKEGKDAEIESLKAANSLLKAEMDSIKKANTAVKKTSKPKKVRE